MSESKSRVSLPAEVDPTAQGAHDSGEHGAHIRLRKHGIGIRKSSTTEATIYSQSLPSEAFISRASSHHRLGPSAAHSRAGPTATLDETTRARRAAALRRLNGTAAKSTRPSSPAPSKPVLVRSHSIDMGSSKAAVPDVSGGVHERSIEKSHYEMPPLEAFSFQEILQSISSDIRVPIERIAEICGKSKLSLANEYSSHKPPHAENTPASFQPANDSIDAVFHHRLLPVEEASTSHERLWDGREPEDAGPGHPMHVKRHSRAKSASWALLGAQPSNQRENLTRTAAPVAETSQVPEVSSFLDCRPITKPRPSPLSPQTTERPASSVDYTTLSNLVPSWLRSSTAYDGPSSPGYREASAIEALHRLLGK